MRIKNGFLRVLLILACLFPLAEIGDIYAQRQRTAGRSKRSTVNRAKCDKAKTASKQKPDSPLLPCGPDISVTNATTFLAPGTVEVSVLVDESGKIISAQPVSGNPILYDRAVKAVNEMKFTPKTISGKAVKTQLIVRYVVTATSK